MTSGARLRVTAQLTEAASDSQVRSERFNRDAAATVQPRTKTQPVPVALLK